MAFNTCKCGESAAVVDSRLREGRIRRRYRCEAGHSFITYEVPRERVESLQSIERAARALSEAVETDLVAA